MGIYGKERRFHFQKAKLPKILRLPQLVKSRKAFFYFKKTLDNFQVPLYNKDTKKQEGDIMNLTKLESDAVKRILASRADRRNNGMFSTVRAYPSDEFTLRNGRVVIDGSTILKNGLPILKIVTRYAARKTEGCYKELQPKLEPID
jgi:hypothetical protein